MRRRDHLKERRAVQPDMNLRRQHSASMNVTGGNLSAKFATTNSPPAKSQNPSPPLYPTTDKLGFSGCLEQSVVTPNPVVGQSTGVHNQSSDDLFQQMENACVSMATRSHERCPYKISFTLSSRPSTSFVHFVKKKD